LATSLAERAQGIGMTTGETFRMSPKVMLGLEELSILIMPKKRYRSLKLE